mmetsp:Transcript_10176/g.14701  ORF Transcript_10176/g.14701 Transcript_10176/m.14701 type:complete len:311 (+) Transcript_10176:73-1005(+)
MNPSAVDETIKNTHVGGRVARLHFACRAELPVGSLLRVTGSSLLTTSSSSSSSSKDDRQGHDMSNNLDALKDTFSSSIEMVTSPDTYPIWRTRKPVTITLLSQSDSPFYYAHRYRYLVVTPGADSSWTNTSLTSNEFVVGTLSPYTQPVTEWENPPTLCDLFDVMMAMDNNNNNNPFDSSIHGAHSMRSPHHKHTPSEGSGLCMIGGVPSRIGTSIPVLTAKYVANLPFRTLFVPLHNVELPSSPDHVRIDTWNNAQDEAWSPFIEISHMIQQRKEQLLLSPVKRHDSMSSDATASSETASSVIDMEAAM